MNVTMFVWPRREARASDLNTTKDAFRFAFYSPNVFGPNKYTKVYHRPFKWWSHSLGGPAPNFSTKIKIITQAKQNKWFPTYLLLLRDAKNVEECEESERCFQNSPGLWASCDDHLLPPGQDMTCDDDVIMRHQDDGDPETDDRKCQYIVHISTPLLHLPSTPPFLYTQSSIDQSMDRIKVTWSVSTNWRIVCFLSSNLSPVYLF